MTVWMAGGIDNDILLGGAGNDTLSRLVRARTSLIPAMATTRVSGMSDAARPGYGRSLGAGNDHINFSVPSLRR